MMKKQMKYKKSLNNAKLLYNKLSLVKNNSKGLMRLKKLS